jgi:integrase
MAQMIVNRWADYSRIRDLSPHDLRRTAITRALESVYTYRQVQMMSKHRDPKTVMRYDHGRENLEQNAVNFLIYDEESRGGSALAQDVEMILHAENQAA